MEADVSAVDGDPTADITALQPVAFAGRISGWVLVGGGGSQSGVQNGGPLHRVTHYRRSNVLLLAESGIGHCSSFFPLDCPRISPAELPLPSDLSQSCLAHRGKPASPLRSRVPTRWPPGQTAGDLQVLRSKVYSAASRAAEDDRRNPSSSSVVITSANRRTMLLSVALCSESVFVALPSATKMTL
jgi:hypothetical protein